MAQPTNYAFDYIGGMSITAGTVLTSAEILAIDANIKIIQLLTDNVKISINGTDGVTFSKGDYAYLLTGHTWTFANNCEIAYGKIVNLVG